MCGIAGIVNLNKKMINKKELEKMINVVKHRGPDDEGYFTDKNVGLGHCRLSIIDLSEAGHQPMTNEDGTIWITYNGEVYNFIELRQELKERGHIFKSHTDTEVIIHSYEEWGKECLTRFNGMWAFALYDLQKRELFCSRDRFGVKPFYYYFDKEKFLFGSEIKELLTFVDAQANDEVIFDYLVFGFANYSEETFFRNIKELPGGHYLSLKVDLASFSINKYYTFFDNDHMEDIETDKSKTHDELYNLLEDSIKIRLRSDLPVGSCLSGGLDSSSIVCLANKLLKGCGNYHQEVFTSCFKETDIDESKYAEEVIKETGCIKNFVFPDFKTLEMDLDELIWHQEQPFGSLSVFSQWSIMKTSKEKGIKVLLDGQAGDELFLGYERYYIYFLQTLLKHFRLSLFLKEFFLIPQNSKLRLKQLIRYYIYFSMPKMRLTKLLKESQQILNREFLALSWNKSSTLQFMNPKSLADLQKKEILYSQLPNLLRYEDRNSMAFSIETRLPFLDYRLVEFAYRLPDRAKIRNGWTKYILRKSMENILPSDIAWRKRKIGFEVPNIWLKMLRPKMKEIFNNNIYSGKYIDKKSFLKNLSENKVPNQLLWRVYCLELWMQKFLPYSI